MGVTSSLLALPIYEGEALSEEWPEWRRLRQEHFSQVHDAFSKLESSERVLLFCHDPSALPFLLENECIRGRVPQIERTIIGHLHSKWVFRQARLMSGMPCLNGFGHTPKRLSRALREARHWKQFKPLLCPSPTGIQLFKDGGYYVAKLDPNGDRPARFEFVHFAWRTSPAGQRVKAG
jgi:hypothetical protein